MKITDINAGDFLEIDARNNSGPLLATSIHRKLLQSGTRFKLEGPVSAVSTTLGSESVTVLGVVFTADNQTTLQVNNVTNNAISINNFFRLISIGDTLTIKDNQSSGNSDGVATELDLKN